MSFGNECGNLSVETVLPQAVTPDTKTDLEIDRLKSKRPCDDDNACLKSVLDELLNGPIGEFEETVPEGTVVSAVRIEGNQATIEFNRTFSDAMLSGSSAEMLAVYSVVNTVAVNFPQVQKVKINVDGNQGVILSHLDLSEPLLPDYSLEQSLSTEPDKGSTVSPTNRKGGPR